VAEEADAEPEPEPDTEPDTVAEAEAVAETAEAKSEPRDEALAESPFAFRIYQSTLGELPSDQLAVERRSFDLSRQTQ
jgi:hypothetical protein